jgi:hypothetical protein
MKDLEERLRNKIFALENQNKVFMARITAFREATLWQRLVMAWKGEV